MQLNALSRSDLINQASMLSHSLYSEHAGCCWAYRREGARHRFLGGENVFPGVILESPTAELPCVSLNTLSNIQVIELLNKNFGWFGLELYGLTFFPENFVYPKVREPLLLSFHSMKNKTN